jgi:hypothetical protein
MRLAGVREPGQHTEIKTRFNLMRYNGDHVGRKWEKVAKILKTVYTIRLIPMRGVERVPYYGSSRKIFMVEWLRCDLSV